MSEGVASLCRMIADRSPDIIWVWTQEHGRRFLNRRWRDLVGTTDAAWTTRLHPEESAAVMAEVAAATDRQHPWTLGYRLRAAAGDYRQIEETATPFLHPDGRFAGYLGIGIDLTERRREEERIAQAQVRLRDSEAALRAIFDSAYDAIFLHDMQGRIIDLNSQMLNLYGVTKEEALGLSIAGDYSSGRNDLALLDRYWQQVMQGETCVFEWIARRPGDGGEFDVEVVLRKIRLPGGEAIIANVRDITVRKLMEKNLRLASRVLENAVEGIVITDADGNIEMVNPAFTVITGYDAAEAIGKTPRLLKSEHHPAEFYRQMWEQLLATGCWAGEIWNRRKSGEAYPEWLSISSIQDQRGKTSHYVAIFHDITEMKKTQAEIQHQAYHDALTGLPNRYLFLDRLEVALHHAQRHGKHVAVLFLDLDHFKNVNDTFGHAAGDELLKEVARRLCRAVREEDTVSRLGGDEFTIILTTDETPEEVALIARRILNEIAGPFPLGEHEFFVSTSIGISIYPTDGQDAETLIKNADMAMYRAKEGGRNDFQFFTREFADQATSRIWLEAELRRAVERREFTVHYQPKIELASGRIAGMEALVRWPRADGTIAGPDLFIPLAEETGMIVAIDEFVLETACAQLRRWHEQERSPLTLAVNLSTRQFRNPDLPTLIHRIVRRHGLLPRHVELEITESLLMQNMESAAGLLAELKRLGFRILLDDFGTGYSSLYYLKRLPIDALKIDRSFVREIPHDRDDMTIAQAIVSLAHALRLTVIAEGVETEAQLRFLRDLGCHAVQGYYFSPPVAAEVMGRLLRGGLPRQAPPAGLNAEIAGDF